MHGGLPLLDHAGLWGVAGAFIYAGPRWVACLVACAEARTRVWPCSLEFGVALVSGGIAAGAFSAAVLDLTGLAYANAVAAMIGLLANPTAPLVANRVSAAIAARLADKVEKGDRP